jgi:uncharacterized protein YndB with AHSA1/START domain
MSKLVHATVPVVLGIATWLSPSLVGEEPASSTRPANSKTDPAMSELSRLVGGAWVNDDPKFVIENRYEPAFGGTAIRGMGVVGKGSPYESQNEAILGWDTVGKSVFYVDCHGGNTVYKGTARKEGDELIFEFATAVGKPSKWREVARFTDTDTFQFTIYGEKEGKWVPVHSQILRRKPLGAGPDQVVTEGIVDAPVEQVWAALVTKDGLESWNVAHADVDLRVGGKMLTHYDPKGRIGDPDTIENIILSFEPKRMLSIKVGTPPAKIPFKDAIKTVWQVLHFEPLGATRTRLQIIGLGYGADEESKKLRSFFEKGNAYTHKKHQEKFAAKGAQPAVKG